MTLTIAKTELGVFGEKEEERASDEVKTNTSLCACVETLNELCPIAKLA